MTEVKINQIKCFNIFLNVEWYITVELALDVAAERGASYFESLVTTPHTSDMNLALDKKDTRTVRRPNV